MTLSERWSQHLAELRAQGRYRTLSAPAGIDLSSNDYLGYGARPRASAASACGNEWAFSRSGLASRLLRGQHPIWDEVEAALAQWHGAEAALMTTSGYVANEGLLSTIVEPEDWVASDALNHASLIDGLRLSRAERFIYHHQDFDHLETGLRRAAQNRPAGRQLFIVTEALFGMSGDRTALTALVELAERYRAHVIVDEAHATGCFGTMGCGLVDAAGLRARVLATVHTGGKALAVPGAYICGSRALRELLINRCRHFIFTTALAPAIGCWWLEAVQCVRSDDARREQLHEAAAIFRTALATHGVKPPGTDYIVPVVIGGDAAALSAASQLQARGYDIRAIRPPTVAEGTAQLRVSVHADHDREMLKATAAAVADAIRPVAK